jgi:hypothetical protein
MARAKKMAPALSRPCSRVCIDSLGSMGEIVSPATSHWTMWAMIRTWTAISTPARHFPTRAVSRRWGRVTTGRATDPSGLASQRMAGLSGMPSG